MGEPVFTPAYITMAGGLIGGAYGFWSRFPTGDPEAIAEGAIIYGLLSVVLVWGAGFLLGLVIDVPT